MIASGALAADTPPDFGYVTDAAQKQAQAKLARLVPNAKHIITRTAATIYTRNNPQLVIQSIREVVNAVRSGNWPPGK